MSETIKIIITVDKELASACRKVLQENNPLRKITHWNINEHNGWCDIYIETTQPADVFWLGFYSERKIA